MGCSPTCEPYCYKTGTGTRDCCSNACKFGQDNPLCKNHEICRKMHGEWSPWGEWMPCPCGFSQQRKRRTRKCIAPNTTLPLKELGGRDCSFVGGEAEEIMPCSNPGCADYMIVTISLSVVLVMLLLVIVSLVYRQRKVIRKLRNHLAQTQPQDSTSPQPASLGTNSSRNYWIQSQDSFNQSHGVQSQDNGNEVSESQYEGMTNIALRDDDSGTAISEPEYTDIMERGEAGESHRSSDSGCIIRLTSDAERHYSDGSSVGGGEYVNPAFEEGEDGGEEHELESLRGSGPTPSERLARDRDRGRPTYAANEIQAVGAVDSDPLPWLLDRSDFASSASDTVSESQVSLVESVMTGQGPVFAPVDENNAMFYQRTGTSAF